MEDTTMEVDPFSMPLRASTMVTQIEDRLALEDAKKMELAEREKFCLKQQTTNGPSEYHERRILMRR
jgi:hypothetical protein